MTKVAWSPALYAVVAVLAGAAYAADQTILGHSITVRGASGDPDDRTVKGSAAEKQSTSTIVGDPTVSGPAGGAVLSIFTRGGTPSAQTFVLSQGVSLGGKSFWTGDAVKGFKYRDPGRLQGPVKSASIRLSGKGTFSIKVLVSGKNGPLFIVPPNPGTGACLALKLGVDGVPGDRYSVQFGPESTITNKEGVLFKAKSPVNEGVCPLDMTTTSTLTSTTIDRCCLEGFCARLNPPGCLDAGGVPLGDGSCEPNPCPTSTTTSSTTTTTIGSPSGAFVEEQPSV